MNITFLLLINKTISIQGKYIIHQISQITKKEKTYDQPLWNTICLVQHAVSELSLHIQVNSSYPHLNWIFFFFCGMWKCISQATIIINRKNSWGKHVYLLVFPRHTCSIHPKKISNILWGTNDSNTELTDTEQLAIIKKSYLDHNKNKKLAIMIEKSNMLF